MKVTLVIGSLDNGGAERVVCNLANYLAGKGHKVSILTVSDEQSYFLLDTIKHVVLYPGSKTRLPHMLVNAIRISKMRNYLRKEKTDVYVTFLPKLSQILLSQKSIIHAPIIVAERCDPNTYYKSSRKNRIGFLRTYPNANAYIFQTFDARAFYEKVGIDVSVSTIIPNAIDAQFITEEYTGPRGKTIVSVGRLAHQKNFKLLIDAFFLIQKDFEEYELIIYGEGPLRQELEDYIRRLGLTEKVKLPGFSNNLRSELQSASMFVLSSNYEGISNALAEAMALGLPCVATACPAGGSRFLIQDGLNGLLVPPGDMDALAKAIRYLLTNREKAEAFSIEARKIIEKLAPDKVYSQWEKFIGDVISVSKKRSIQC